jgi:hypothetical protein
MANINAQEMTI